MIEIRVKYSEYFQVFYVFTTWTTIICMCVCVTDHEQNLYIILFSFPIVAVLLTSHSIVKHWLFKLVDT